MTAREVQIDGRTRIVPDAAGFRLERVDDPVRPSKRQASMDAYPTTAAALRAAVAETVRWGQWRAVA